MGQKEIQDLFFENPGKEFYLRQISTLTKTPKTTSATIVADLLQQQIIKKVKSLPYNKFVSSNTLKYRFLKKQNIQEKIIKSGLLDFIIHSINPRLIILFGSCAKGEYTKESDIDIFVQGNGSLNVSKYKLKHTVNVFYEPDLNKLSVELRNNIINGIILYGVLRL